MFSSVPKSLTESHQILGSELKGLCTNDVLFYITDLAIEGFAYLSKS